MRLGKTVQCLTLGAGLAVGLAIAAAPAPARADHDDTRAVLRLVAAGLQIAAYAGDAHAHGAHERFHRRGARIEARRIALVRNARRALDRGNHWKASRLFHRIAQLDRERRLLQAQYRRHGGHHRAACAPPRGHGAHGGRAGHWGRRARHR